MITVCAFLIDPEVSSLAIWSRKIDFLKSTSPGTRLSFGIDVDFSLELNFLVEYIDDGNRVDAVTNPVHMSMSKLLKEFGFSLDKKRTRSMTDETKQSIIFSWVMEDRENIDYSLHDPSNQDNRAEDIETRISNWPGNPGDGNKGN